MGFNSVTRVDDAVPVRNVIVSVYDKTGLDDFIRSMAASCPGVRFYSTGGTYDRLAALVAPGSLVRMSDYTGQPEMKGGLVKTLDWKLYLGLLAEPYDEAHDDDLRRAGAVRFDMVVGNLYPFAAASAAAKRFEDARQNIDIGGPCMLRAAAKNFLRVAAVCHPGQYARVAAALEAGTGSLTLALRTELAGEVFRRQSEYDGAIATWFDDRAANASASYEVR